METKQRSAFKSAAARSRVLADYDEVVASWPVPCREGEVTTSQGTTHFLASGPEVGRPLVLLHGGGGNATTWIHNIEGLASGRQVLALDILGDLGKSIGPRPSDAEGYVRWLGEVLTALGLSRVDLCGTSYGAWMAGCFAGAFPDRVGRLALLAPPHLGKMRASLLLRAVVTSLLPTSGMIRSFYRAISSPRAPWPEVRDMEHFLRRWRAQRASPPPPPVATPEEMARWPDGALVLVGEDETFYDPRPAVRRVAAAAPQVDVELVEGAGHTLPVDRAAWVTERLVDYFGA